MLLIILMSWKQKNTDPSYALLIHLRFLKKGTLIMSNQIHISLVGMPSKSSLMSSKLDFREFLGVIYKHLKVCFNGTFRSLIKPFLSEDRHQIRFHIRPRETHFLISVFFYLTTLKSSFFDNNYEGYDCEYWADESWQKHRIKEKFHENYNKNSQSE